MFSEEEWKELEAEFKRGYEISQQNIGESDFVIVDKLKKAKVGKGKVKFDLVLKNSELLGTCTNKYEGKFNDLEKKVEALIKSNELEGLAIDAKIQNNCYYFSSGGNRVGIAATYGVGGKNFEVFKILAVKIYGF